MEKIAEAGRSGLIIGKFLPPHQGHQYLFDFARSYAERLTVLVCTLRTEPIPGETRAAWVREMIPCARVVHVTDENPQDPREHPEFWQIWERTIRRVLPEGPDFVFASESYGWKLAEVLGAEYVPVDHARQLVPISGSEIRDRPMQNWDYIPSCVRPHYVRRVCVFGPESTGKSSLARQLAKHYRTVYAAEYARGLLDHKDGRCDPEDIERIARGHIASEEALARQANRVLFCDTDVITTTIWSEILFGGCPKWIREEADRRAYHLYLLTDVDVPWVKDPQRYQPADTDRRKFLQRCIGELERRRRPYARISGTWEERFARACAAVDDLLERA
ncbi:MAG: AAA family ATPase [Acidobacteria bacterium]|nr:AAA family ATPase [Acidobacteriota bacterium]